MRFKIWNMKLSSGWPYVGIVNKLDAKRLGLHPFDRVKISSGKKKCIAILNISKPNCPVRNGEVGVFEELGEALGNVRFVNITPEPKPVTLEFIKKKMDGFHLNKKEIFQIIKDITDRRLSDIELTYFVNAFYMNGFTDDEVVWLTDAMIKTGETLEFGSGTVVDKHCIGGIPGNRTSMLIVPIIAANGLLIPKTSSRSVTSPAGTADTMEVLANVTMSKEDISKIVKKIGGCIVWGGSVNLAPADDQIIRVEHPISIDAEGQLLASVIAKKASVGSKHLLIDIPYGPQAKCRTHNSAKKLGEKFFWLGKKFGMNTHIALTHGAEPIGNGIGPALEAIDVMKVLHNAPDAPLDLKAKVLHLSSIIFEMGGKAKKGEGFELARQTLDSGKALKKMNQIIDAQGRKVRDYSKIELGKIRKDIKAKKSGKIKSINIHTISSIAKAAGAPLDKGAGIFMHKHVGESVKKGEPLFTIYGISEPKFDSALSILKEDPIEI